VAGEEPGLHAVIGLPDDQQLAAVLLKNHRLSSLVSTALIISSVHSASEGVGQRPPVDIS
jgi:hypothetical protein